MKKGEKQSNKSVLLIIITIIVIICAVLVMIFLKSRQDIYKFDFYDGYIPGKTFTGEINLTNGKVDFKIIYGCSLPDSKECPDDVVVKGTLNKTQLELVKTAIEKNNRKDNPDLLNGISYLILEDKICNEETNESCGEIGKQLIEALAQN